MDKCMYCQREIAEPHTAVVGKDRTRVVCCSDDCIRKSGTFMGFFDRHKTHFFILLAAALIIFFTGVILLTINKSLGSILFSIGFGMLGLDVVLFPFATPQTFQMLGIKKTAMLTRVMGVVLIALSPVLAYLMMI